MTIWSDCFLFQSNYSRIYNFLFSIVMCNGYVFQFLNLWITSCKKIYSVCITHKPQTLINNKNVSSFKIKIKTRYFIYNTHNAIQFRYFEDTAANWSTKMAIDESDILKLQDSLKTILQDSISKLKINMLNTTRKSSHDFSDWNREGTCSGDVHLGNW